MSMLLILLLGSCGSASPETAVDTATTTQSAAFSTVTSPLATTISSLTLTPTAKPTPVEVALSIPLVPATLTIVQGTQVIWTNHDTTPHTVTSDSGNLLHSATIQPGASFAFVFDQPGTFSYHCAIHPSMQGKIVVQPVGLADAAITPNSGIKETAALKLPPDNAALPNNYGQLFFLYNIVDRPDGFVRKLYIDQNGLEAIKNGKVLPAGTTTVIETYSAKQSADGKFLNDKTGHMIAGQLQNIHLGEKVKGFSVGFPSDLQNGDWEYGTFDANGQRTVSDFATCRSCHVLANQQDFIFSMPQLVTAATTGEVQYRYCNLPDRQVCP
jgi:plastocyanin